MEAVELGEDEVRLWVSGLKMWMKAGLGLQGEDSRRTHHSLPQDQTLRGVGVDLKLDGLGGVEGTGHRGK